jgi:hypothetical protein
MELSSRGWKREKERDEAGAEPPAAARWRGRRRSWRAGAADRRSRLAIVVVDNGGGGGDGECDLE